jgi:hypothetical protein
LCRFGHTTAFFQFVNAVAAIDGTQMGILAMMGTQRRAAPTGAADGTAFLNLFNFLAPESNNIMAPVTPRVASPANIAGALIRSMLGMKTANLQPDPTTDTPPIQANGSQANVPDPLASATNSGGSVNTTTPQPQATVLPALDQTALLSPLAFSACLMKASGTGDRAQAFPGTLQPAAILAAKGHPSTPNSVMSDAAAADEAGGDESQGNPTFAALPIAKIDPCKRERDETPSQTPAGADFPGSTLLMTNFGAVPDHAALPVTRLAEAAAPQALGEALRASEPLQAAPTPSTPSTHQIIVRVSQAQSSPVDLQVTQRGGEVHVAVRTADPALQSSLRRDLPTLVNSLEHAGYRAETFTPQSMGVHSMGGQGTVAQAVAASSESAFSNQHQDSQSDSSNANWPGASDRHQQEHRQRDQQRQNWFKEMEKNNQ